MENENTSNKFESKEILKKKNILRAGNNKEKDSLLFGLNRKSISYSSILYKSLLIIIYLFINETIFQKYDGNNLYSFTNSNLTNNIIKDLFKNELISLLKNKSIFLNYEIKNEVYYKKGGKVRYYIVPEQDQNIIKNIILLCNEYNIDYFILGKGSNIIFNNEGYNGLVINLRKFTTKKLFRVGNNSLITLGSGISLDDAINLAYNNSLSGFEFLSDIPGTIGGAVAKNIGAFGKELRDIILNAKVITNKGEIKILNKNDLNFRFRRSKVYDEKYIVLEATFILNPKSKEEISNLIMKHKRNNNIYNHIYINKYLPFKESRNEIKKIRNSLVCTVAKNENKYIREWVEHYKSIGISHIIIYDNNKEGDEKYEEELNDFIKEGYVDIINIRGKEIMQFISFADCYHEHNSLYKWIGLFDVDEFVSINESNTYNNDINNFLNSDLFKEAESVCLPWKIFNDNNIIKVVNNNYSVKKRFTSYHRSLKYKSFNRGGLGIYSVWHSFNLENDVKEPFKHIKAFNAAGEKAVINNMILKNPVYSPVCINHYLTKSLEEFIKYKSKRGYATTFCNHGKCLNLNYFFRYCRKTKEKIDYINKIMFKNRTKKYK